MQTLFDHFNELMDKGAYIQLKQELNEENAADLAEYFEELSAEKQLFIFRLLTKDMAAEVFSYMDSDTQEHIVHSITDKEVRNIVDEMFLGRYGGLSGGSTCQSGKKGAAEYRRGNPRPYQPLFELPGKFRRQSDDHRVCETQRRYDRRCGHEADQADRHG